MSTTVQKIKDRLSIADVISSYIDIENSGSNFKAKCPFHHEKTASFYISPERNSYYCFGCAAKGDIFNFVQEFEGVDFVGALKILADRAGVIIEKFEKTEKNNLNNIFNILEDATDFFVSNLKNNNEALLYLKKRCLNIETLRSWRLGFAPNDWRSLKTYLSHKGYTEKEMLDAGLIKGNEKGDSYDRFRGRIMFPIFDTAGRVIAFSGRILVPKEEEPKYLNSPDTELFDKSNVLYGYNVAKNSIRQKQFAVLVEGQMDLLMSHQAGITNTVASSGTALTVHHLEIIRRLASTIIIAYDADNAGRNATLRAWKIALSLGLDTKIAFLPDGLDPADAIIKDEKIWTDSIGNSENIIDYFIRNMKDESDSSLRDFILKDKILPLVKYVSSAIDRSRFLQKISFTSGIPESALIEELTKIKEDTVTHDEISIPNKIVTNKVPEAIGFLLYLQSKNDPYTDKYRNLLNDIDNTYDNLVPKNIDDINRLIFESEIHYGEEEKSDVVGMKLLYRFEEDVLKRDFATTMDKIKKLESIHDVSGVEEQLKHCQDISLKLSGLFKKYNST